MAYSCIFVSHITK